MIKNITIQEIAEILGRDYILEGSVRKAGNELRIAAQLIQVAEDRHLWSKTYDKELKVEEMFSVQEDIATAVANELKMSLGIDESFEQLKGTDNLEAYSQYLIAKGQFNDAEYRGALASVDAAVASDPQFASAWAMKALVHMSIAAKGMADQAAAEQDAALIAALQAIELDPNLAGAHLVAGLYETIKGDFIAAELSYEKALELQITEADIKYVAIVLHYLAVGHLERAQTLFERIFKDDPYNTVRSGFTIVGYGLVGDVDSAEAEYERGKAWFGNDWSNGDNYITLIRMGSSRNLSPDDVAISDPTFNKLLSSNDSPEEKLLKLYRLYDGEKDTAELLYLLGISVFAAYFGDPAFAMDVMEEVTEFDSIDIWMVWLPL